MEWVMEWVKEWVKEWVRFNESSGSSDAFMMGYALLDVHYLLYTTCYTLLAIH